MTRRVEGRLAKLERSRSASTAAGWAAMDLQGLRSRVAATFGLSRAELERLIDRPADHMGDDHPAASAYWARLGDQMRSDGLTFLDLRDLAEQAGQEVAR